MNTPFIVARTDNSLSAILNRALTAAFSLAVVGMIGVMTCVQYLNSVRL